MKRENTNKIRFILEEIIPPTLRDSFIFKYLVKFLYRSDNTHQKLKNDILNISKKEYLNYYKKLPKIHNNSDLSEICINEILRNIEPTTVIDIGCGDGFLLERINKTIKQIKLFGTDIYVSTKLSKVSKKKNFKIFHIKVENISNINKKFDTVICSHVLEHILDINLAYNKLKKICKKKLIIVVPRERAYEHTFNGHLHFFPYPWSFINTIRPKNKFTIKDLKRDLVYIENLQN